MVFVTLASQAVDSNALLGNVDLSYRFGFWDGAVLPIGLGISLVLNGIFLAHHVNNDEVLTLPDILAKRYGRVVETLASFACVVSFIMLLAGNLLGYGVITAYLWNISEEAAIWLAALCIWLYTVLGGLFSVAYTDVVQGLMGWTGCLVLAFYMIANEDPSAPPQSIGFPGMFLLLENVLPYTMFVAHSIFHVLTSLSGYIYPDTMDDPTGACATYDGVACTNDVNLCCYNIDKWCPGYDADPTITCEVYDRGAYPFGDLRVYPGSMTDSMAYAPFPNALFWNWATIFILGFGNLGALDFQARCMAATTPRVARIGCVMAGLFTILIGIPFSYLGAITRSVLSIYLID
jgi:Na+/proline symporter